MFSKKNAAVLSLIVVAVVIFPGCHAVPHSGGSITESVVPSELTAAPRELAKTALPEYVIEPPDILSIETVRAVPRAPYRLNALDVLYVCVSGTYPDAPINGAFSIQPDGTVNLGAPYGCVSVSGLTFHEAEIAVETHLKHLLRHPEVTVSLLELDGRMHLAGEFLVGPDGTVTLGPYGSVSVVGLTVAEAKRSIESYLSHYFGEIIVSVSVHGFNSKAYYVVMQGAELGDAVFRYPITGNETVLDAISRVQGLQLVSSKRMWIARPTSDQCHHQILPVDWYAVTECGAANTNFQLMPGDRLFIAEDKLVAFDNRLAKVFAPIERVMGFSLLTVGTVTRYSGRVLKGGGNPRIFLGGF